MAPDSPLSDQSLYPPYFNDGDLYDRQTPTDELCTSIQLIFDINSSDAARRREKYPIFFSSGISGIGKSTFGQMVIKKMLEDASLPPPFRSILYKVNTLMVECNGGGDKFTNADIPLSPQERFLVRVLSRACRVPQGVEGLRALLVSANKSSLDLFVEEMKYAGLIDVSRQLRRYESGMCPSMKDILGAIAADIRRASGNEREPVGIWLHVDEHQLIYDDVKRTFGLNDKDMLENHRDFLYPALDVLASGWCYDNEVFFIPFFTGTNHFCLKELIKQTRHSRKYIQLEPLTKLSSEIMLRKEVPYEIHHSWFDPLSKNGTVSPIEVLCREVLNVPRAIKGLGSTIIKDELMGAYSIEKLATLLRGSKYVFVNALSKLCKFVALASVCGVILEESEWEELGYLEVTPYAILEGEEDSARVLIPLAVLAKSAGKLEFPIPLQELMHLSESAMRSLPCLWKEVVAYRFSFIFIVLRQLYRKSVSLINLLGPDFFIASDSPTPFQLNFKLPIDDGVCTDLSPLFRITKQKNETRTTYIDPIKGHIQALVARAQPIDLGDQCIGMFTSAVHPVADIVLVLERVANSQKFMLVFVSVKGPSDVADSGGIRFKDLPVERDLEALVRVKDEVGAFEWKGKNYSTHISLVYLLSKEQPKDKLDEFRTTVRGLNCEGISVAVVSNMSAFLPPLAHRLSYLNEISPSSMMIGVKEV